DLGRPGAPAVAQACATDAATSPGERLAALASMDQVLGLDLDSVARERDDAPIAIRDVADEHARARASLHLRDADAMRARFDGWRVDDHPGGTLISDASR